MRTALLAALVLLAIPAHADTFKLYLTPHGGSAFEIGSFQYNGELTLPAFTINLPGFDPVPMRAGGSPLMLTQNLLAYGSWPGDVMRIEGATVPLEHTLNVDAISVSNLGAEQAQTEDAFIGTDVLTVVNTPEGGTGLMLLIGLLGIAWRRRESTI